MRPALTLHARRIGKYMSKCGLRTLAVNAVDWDSDAAMKAYAAYAREIPDLDGILAVQYYPYTGGDGAIRWVKAPNGRQVPVVSARNAIWAERKDNPREGTPARVAQMLSADMRKAATA